MKTIYADSANNALTPVARKGVWFCVEAAKTTARSCGAGVRIGYVGDVGIVAVAADPETVVIFGCDSATSTKASVVTAAVGAQARPYADRRFGIEASRKARLWMIRKARRIAAETA